MTRDARDHLAMALALLSAAIAAAAESMARQSKEAALKRLNEGTALARKAFASFDSLTEVAAGKKGGAN
jgi:hypothetical protein